MSACSPKEEIEWRSRLNERSDKESLACGEQALYTSLSLEIKPMGTVFGKPGKLPFFLSGLEWSALDIFATLMPLRNHC
jgi:hypothetical protein